ncbi:MAG: phosphoglycerate kinase [Thermoplasmataceae archaeon]|jgi:phosphoglycerate kinase|nr:phosphoglycerate kinase [Candidatus Thermoplasmatota archaeon]
MGKPSLDFFTMDDFDLEGKTVYLRLDINSPINPITNEIIGVSRFLSHTETISMLRHSKVVLIGHQSRPGKDDFTSMEDHSRQLQRIIGRKITFVDEMFSSSARKAISSMSEGEIIMLENSRFYSEETDIPGEDIERMEQSNIVRRLEPLFDYFVIDAFPAIHRSQTSLVGFHRLKPNIAGKLVEREVIMLDRFRFGRENPKIAVLAGSKIDDSIKVSKSFLDSGTVNSILTGGVVGNAFLWASGKDIGKRNRDFIIKNNRNHEKLVEICREILKEHSGKIIMPRDAVLSPSGRRVSMNEDIPDNETIADIGLDTIAQYSEILESAGAIFMNGPMGIYEIPEYSVGTREVLTALASSDALKIAGGGHTLSALEHLGLIKRVDHASTGGGALISYLSGEPMPVLEALRESKRIFKGKENGN